MLDKIREISIGIWKPVGEMFSSAWDTSNIWFPIISYVVVAILLLYVLKKILDMTVNSASSVSLKFSWSFLKKLIIYTVSIAVTITIVGTLYFYLESLYKEHEKVEESKQSLDYLLR